MDITVTVVSTFWPSNTQHMAAIIIKNKDTRSSQVLSLEHTGKSVTDDITASDRGLGVTDGGDILSCECSARICR